MKFSVQEIKALEAAIDQFDDMVSGGSEDARHAEYQSLLVGVLKKVKAHNRSNIIVATKPQIAAIQEQFSDCLAMLGNTGADDSVWVKNIKLVNRMLKANNLSIIE